ncbi:MAG: 30S ribosomal protein S7 [Alphaproteobacteria bacterium]
MSRRRKAEKRTIHPDAKFGEVMLSKFINILMLRGKKSIAEGIVYGALDRLGARGGDPIENFRNAVENVKPNLEVRSRRVGGATYQVPVDVSPSRAQALAFRWIISMARKRSENTMIDRLAGELNDAANNRGQAVKKREDTHKMAEANRAFAHYRW